MYKHVTITLFALSICFLLQNTALAATPSFTSHSNGFMVPVNQPVTFGGFSGNSGTTVDVRYWLDDNLYGPYTKTVGPGGSWSDTKTWGATGGLYVSCTNTWGEVGYIGGNVVP